MKRLLANKKIRIILIVALVVLIAVAAAVFLLRERLFPQEEDLTPKPIDAPLQYVLGEVKFPSFTAGNVALVYDDLEKESLAALALTEEEKAKGKTAVQQENEVQETEEESEEEESAPLIAYRYEEMLNAPQLVQVYAALLTAEDIGFLYADKTLKELEEAPPLEGTRGTVHLIYRIPEIENGEEEEETEEEAQEPQAIALRLVWEKNRCEVTAELVPVSVTIRPEPKPELGGMFGGFMQTLTFSGAVDQIKMMHPSVLELEGESMEDYLIYSRDGLALIDGQSCMRIDIYRRDSRTGTNVAAGNYFLSADGMHLYRLNEEAHSVRELSMVTNTLPVAAPNAQVETISQESQGNQ